MRRLALFVFLFVVNMMVCGYVMAEDGASNLSAVTGLALSAGLAIGLAAFGGAMGQGRAASSALEGIARNPGAAAKIQTPMIIGLALIESLVIYALVIAFLLQGKIDALLK